MRKVIEVLLLLESQGGVIGENGRIAETAMGDVVKHERCRGEETPLDIMKGRRMLVIFREFLEEVHRVGVEGETRREFRWGVIGHNKFDSQSRLEEQGGIDTNMMERCLSLIACSCMNELDARLTIMVCLIATFSQSLIGAMFLPFPYLILSCIGIFFSLFFVFSSRQMYTSMPSHLLLFFLFQQVVSLWSIYYWYDISYDVLYIILHSWFLFTSSVGSLVSYRLTELIRPYSQAVDVPLV